MNKSFSTERIKNVPPGEDSLAYIRVSTQEQAINTNALNNQRERVKQEGVSLIITDAKTRKSTDRGGLTEMMKLVQQGQIKSIIVTRLGRLGRTVPIIRDNIAIIQEYKVDLKVLDQNIDLNTPEGIFIVNLLASLAEMEIHQLPSRVKADE